MVPRFHLEETGEFADFSSFYTADYSGGIAALGVESGNVFTYWDNSPILPTPKHPSCLLGGALPLITIGNAVSPMGPQTVEKLGCLFIHYPDTGLFKFDGSQTYRAGVPLPHFSSTNFSSGGPTYLRLIQHHIDFQSNIVNSGYVEFRAIPIGNLVDIRHDKNAATIIGNGAETPAKVTSKLDGSFDEFFFVMTSAVVNAFPSTIVVTTGGNHYVENDCYVVVSASEVFGAVTAFSNIPSQTTYGLAFRVLSSDATTVTLSRANVKYIDASGQWQSGATVGTGTTLFSTVRNGSNYWFSAYASNVATGNYVFRGLFPCLYNSTVSKTDQVDVASVIVPLAGYDKTAFNLTGNLGDGYDVTTAKDVYQQGTSSFSTYGELAVISNENEVLFSDTSLGGAFEMKNGLSFIVVGEGNDGNIQAVCGNADFLLVSRQKKNYYVAGNLPTANYRTQPITNTSVGVYSNESCVPYEDKIVFLNKQGVWALYSGARCAEASESVRGLFDNWANTTEFSEESYFDITDYPTFVNLENLSLLSSTENYWIRARVDHQRGLIAFLTAGPSDAGGTFFGKGMALILNMNNGEFYTWSGFTENLISADPNPVLITNMAFKNGSMLTNIVKGNAGNVFVELKTGIDKYGYRTDDHKILLKNTWFNAGEPSLEKKLNQLKMWGIITSDIAVTHCLDWKENNVDDDDYVNTDADLFSHKKRLTPANFLAVSASLDINPGATGRFELEGLEIEFQPFQQGMKR
jgi:hypothetical protein